MSSTWTIDRVRALPGDNGQILILDREDGPDGRTVCSIQGHLAWQRSEDDFVRLLDEQDIENARLIAAAPAMRRILADLLQWAAQTGGWEAACWAAACSLLAKLRQPAGKDEA